MATLAAKRFSIYFGCWQQHITQPIPLHPRPHTTKFLLPMTSYRCRRQESISVAINHRTLFNLVARDFQPADITLEFCQTRSHLASIVFLGVKACKLHLLSGDHLFHLLYKFFFFFKLYELFVLFDNLDYFESIVALKRLGELQW